MKTKSNRSTDNPTFWGTHPLEYQRATSDMLKKKPIPNPLEVVPSALSIGMIKMIHMCLFNGGPHGSDWVGMTTKYPPGNRPKQHKHNWQKTPTAINSQLLCQQTTTQPESRFYISLWNFPGFFIGLFTYFSGGGGQTTVGRVPP